MGRQRDDRDVAQRCIGFDAAGRLPAIDDGQRQVHEDQIRVRVFRHPHALGTVHSREDFIGVLQELHHQVPVELRVFHHEDPFHALSPPVWLSVGSPPVSCPDRLAASLVIPP
jgi:hypothetical protein